MGMKTYFNAGRATASVTLHDVGEKTKDLAARPRIAHACYRDHSVRLWQGRGRQGFSPVSGSKAKKETGAWSCS